MPEDDSPTIAMAELVLDPTTKQYTYRTHYTTEAVTTDQPWKVTIDLPERTGRRARLIERAAGRTDG